MRPRAGQPSPAASSSQREGSGWGERGGYPRRNWERWPRRSGRCWTT